MSANSLFPFMVALRQASRLHNSGFMPTRVSSRCPPQATRSIASHAVHIIGYDDVLRKFTFANSWGPSWGDKGYGYLPYGFFDKWFVEAFIVDGVGEFPANQPKKGIRGIAWAKRDFSGRVFFAREFYDADADERIGWAFALRKTITWKWRSSTLGRNFGDKVMERGFCNRCENCQTTQDCLSNF